MNLLAWVTTALLVFATATPTFAQQCDEPFYRWSEKIDPSLADSVPHGARILTILRSWDALPLFAGDTCEPRRGRELKVYSVTGYVRHVDKTEEDKDWHIELTSRRDSPEDSCIIVEIPLVDGQGNEGNYVEARKSLDDLLAANAAQIDSHNDVSPPVKLRFIGAAFFDGTHHTLAGGAFNHGSCNLSARALWEIHPVYWVLPPAQ